MRKHYFTCLIAIFLSLSLFAQDRNYIITGSARRYSRSYIAYLQYKGKNGEVKDSVQVKDGSFTFTGRIDEPRPACIVLKKAGKKISSQNMIKFYIEPGNISATARSLFSNAEITGSPSTKDNIAINRLLANIYIKGAQTIKITNQIIPAPADRWRPLAVSANNYYPILGPQVILVIANDISKLPYELQFVVENVRDETKYKVLDFIKDHPGSFVSMYALNLLWQAKTITSSEYLSFFSYLDKSLLESNEGKLMFPRQI